MSYASTTIVAVSESRGEIDGLLRKWGAKKVLWGDDWDAGQVLLRFVWNFEDRDYGARIVLQLPTDDELRRESRHATTGQFLQSKFEKLGVARGRSEHRLLLLWLKASFNAIEAGLIQAEALFLPFLEGSDGLTVAEFVLPRIATMLQAGGTKNLLTLGDGK